MDAPFAEMLAVVSKEIIAILAESRTGPLNDFPSGKWGRNGRSYRNGPSPAEILERNLFNRSTGQDPGHCAAMDDPARTQVDAMMDEAEPGSDEMSTDRGLLTTDERMVASGGILLGM